MPCSGYDVVVLEWRKNNNIEGVGAKERSKRREQGERFQS